MARTPIAFLTPGAGPSLDPPPFLKMVDKLRQQLANEGKGKGKWRERRRRKEEKKERRKKEGRKRRGRKKGRKEKEEKGKSGSRALELP